MAGRLSVRIALAVGLLALAIGGFVSFLSYFHTQSEEISAARRALDQLGKTIRGTAAIAAYLDNREIAYDTLLGLMNNEIVAAASLTSETGLSVRLGDPGEGAESSPVILGLASPFIAGEVVGELTIFPRHELILLNAKAAALGQAILLGGYTVIMALLVMAVVQWQFVPRLRQLAQGLHAINPGSADRLPEPGEQAYDEIVELTYDVNRLLDLVQDKLDSERGLREEIESLERRFRLIYERASVGIFMLDSEGRLITGNAAFKSIIGADNACLLKQDCNCLPEVFADLGVARKMVEQTFNEGKLITVDLRLTRGLPDDPRWAHCLFSRVREAGDDESEDQFLLQCILSDITERKKEEQRIRFLSERDPLTHLRNRRSSELELAVALENAAVENSCVAVCLIDLDNFKPINDTYGHEAGDWVLVELAKRITSTLRENDLAARLGGDEFLVALMGVSDRKSLEALAAKLLKVMTEAIELPEGVMVQIGASMGIALSKDHGNNLSNLLALADRAMYAVKNTGKNNFQICDRCVV